MTGQEINSIIETLANSLGTSAEKLVEIYTPWVKAQAIIGIAVTGFVSVVVLLLFLAAVSKYGFDIDEVPVVCLAIMVVAAVIAVIGSLCGLGPDLLAPQAAAVTKIISQIPR